MARSRYSELLTHYPATVLAVILVLVTCSTLLNILVAKPPDFSDPLLGFVPRYSEIHSAHLAWYNLLEETTIGSELSKQLTTYPRELGRITSNHLVDTTPYSGNINTTDVRSKREVDPVSFQITPTVIYNGLNESSRNLTDKELFFCDSEPRRGYGQVVFSTGTNFSNLDMEVFDGLCHLESTIESLSSYSPVCEQGCLCRSFSLVNYATYFADKSSCNEVTSDDLRDTVQLLEECKHYVDEIAPECWLEDQLGSRDCEVEPKCARVSIFEFYYYIVSKDTTLTVSYIHMAKGRALYPLYLDISDIINDFRHESVKPIALDFGLKEYVFEMFLLIDSFWIMLALVIVIIILCLYTESIFITFMTFISMIFTVILSFSLYQFVLQIEYFPFLNLLAVVVIVGIGADDLFIYWKTWTAIKMSRNASILERIVTYTFRHASAAMFVTSASTATAFYACAYTDIVSVRCFCIYAGTCVLIHYILAITWLPACVVLYEKYALSLCSTAGQHGHLSKFINSIHNCITRLTRSIQERQSLISTWSYVWLPIFVLLSTASAVALFYWPKFSPPSSDMFQVLSANHPFEIYDMQIKNRLRTAGDQDYLPTIFVFGVKPEFNGNYFNLASTGSMVLQSLPDLSMPDTQLWFSDFCYELRQQSFFYRGKLQPIGCFIEEFRTSMRFKPCSEDPICCENATFPYEQSVFIYCLKKWSFDERNTKLNRVDPGVRYKGDEPSVIIISFWSNVKFDYNYNTMQTFNNNVSQFIEEQVSNCPFASCDVFTPFFTTSGGLLFYDVQRMLVSSLPTTLAVVILSASAIIFLTTLNVLLTISALISISCSIMTTLGALALMKWELNILESVIVSLAVGLSMDFPLHVAVAYRIASSTQNRKCRVILTLRHVGGSLTAAMTTSLVAGLCMLPAEVLAYQKLGIFLSLVALISWFYAMFFMPSLLIYIGPVGNFLQINCGWCCQQKQRGSKPLEKTIYSDEVSSEVAQPLPSSNTSHTLLETVIEEDWEDSEVDVLDAVTPLSSLLEENTAKAQCYDRMSPIVELHVSLSSQGSTVSSL